MANPTRHLAFPAQAWVERLIEPFAAGATILDLGCGAGEPIGRFLISRGFAVIGVDHAQSAIDLARIRFPGHKWIKADMRSVTLAEPVDGVIAWNALTWLSHADQARMTQRAAGWLRSGGGLLLHAPLDQDPTRNDYRDGTPYHADLDRADYSAALTANGLLETAHVPEDPGCDRAAVWLARKP